MGRLLFFAIIAVLIIWIFKRFYHKKIIDKNESAPISESEDMVCCNYCGLHLPKSESIMKNHKFYCSEDHYKSSIL